MKVLSIRQPWAWLIVHGYKDIENRTWRTSHRGRIYVHAGQTMDLKGWLTAQDILRSVGRTDLVKTMDKYKDDIFAMRGGIVGQVDLVDCVQGTTSPWYMGGKHHGFVLENAEPMQIVPCKGQLGFFNPPAELMA